MNACEVFLHSYHFSIYLLAILEEKECWHARDLVLHGHVLDVVHIHFEEHHVSHLLAQGLGTTEGSAKNTFQLYV